LTKQISSENGCGLRQKKRRFEGMKALKIILGIVLILLGVAGIVIWFSDVLALIRGGIGIVVLLAGVIALAIAKE